MSGLRNAAELPHRISQKFIEAVLRRHAPTVKNVAGGEMHAVKASGPTPLLGYNTPADVRRNQAEQG